MATFTIQYRSTKDSALLEARLTYETGEMKINNQGKTYPERKSIYAQTKVEVSSSFWDDYNGYTRDDKGRVDRSKPLTPKGFRDVQKINLADDIDDLKKE